MADPHLELVYGAGCGSLLLGKPGQELLVLRYLCELNDPCQLRIHFLKTLHSTLSLLSSFEQLISFAIHYLHYLDRLVQILFPNFNIKINS
jgi:hypothetical protein